MARYRTIKPTACTDEDLAACSRDARLLFHYLGTFCDDYGRHLWSPFKVKMEVFPADSDLDIATVERLMDELLEHKLIADYEVDGKRYLAYLGWSKHQRVDKPQKSTIPVPFDEHLRACGERSENGPGTPQDSSSVHRRPVAEESKTIPAREERREEKGKGEKEKRAEARATNRASRFKPEAEIPGDWRAACQELRPDLDPATTYAAFSDFWIARPGQAGVKLDWLATWRNWCRKEMQRAAVRSESAPDWWKSADGITAKAREFSITTPANGATPAQRLIFNARVFVAAGEGPWIDERNATMMRAIEWVRAESARPDTAA